MLHTQLKGDSIVALKARDEVRLTTLRGLISAITNEVVAQKRKPNEILEDSDVLTVIKRSVKQRKDSIEQFEKGGRDDLAQREKDELAILESYMPAQMSREDIELVVNRMLKTFDTIDPSKIGIVVGAVMKELNGAADGSLVKEVILEKIS